MVVTIFALMGGYYFLVTGEAKRPHTFLGGGGVKHYLKSGITPVLYSYACSYKARVEARVKGDAEYIPNKLQFIQKNCRY